MSRRRVYSDNTLAIMERFFTAFDIAVQNRLIKSIAEYCRDNSIAPPHFYTQRKDRNRGSGLRHIRDMAPDRTGHDVPAIEKGIETDAFLR